MLHRSKQPTKGAVSKSGPRYQSKRLFTRPTRPHLHQRSITSSPATSFAASTRKTASSPSPSVSISHSFRTSRAVRAGPHDRYGDTWTKQAKAMGFPSRAVFKLLEAQKKHSVIKKDDVVVDLGCSPGSWSKLSAQLAGGNGFVLGLDLTPLSPSEQQNMGVRPGDIDQTFSSPKTHDLGFKSAFGGELLASEKRLLKHKAPVGYLHQDVTTWQPGSGFEHNVDVILSDMAPKTTGVPSADSASSIDLCYEVIDLCSKLFKAPVTTSRQLSADDKQRVLQEYHQSAGIVPGIVDNLKNDVDRLLHKKYKGNEKLIAHNKLDLSVIKKTMKKHAYLEKKGALGVNDTEDVSAIYKTSETTLAQIHDHTESSTRWRGTLMMKVFQGEGYADLVHVLKQVFVTTHTFKPVSSRSESVEIFLICKGYCGPFAGTRITNKHIRRLQTTEYLKQYKTNNKKMPPVDYNPDTDHVKFQTYADPVRPAVHSAVVAAESASDQSTQRFPASMSIQEIYARLNAQAASEPVSTSYSHQSTRQQHQTNAQPSTSAFSFTSDAFAQQQADLETIERYEDMAETVIAQGLRTNVHAAIRNAGAREDGEMTPLQRHLSETDDFLIHVPERFNELYGKQRQLNVVPSPEDLSKSLSLFWDEGLNFAKKVTVDQQLPFGAPARIDIKQQNNSIWENMHKDDIDAILADDFASLPTSASQQKKHQYDITPSFSNDEIVNDDDDDDDDDNNNTADEPNDTELHENAPERAPTITHEPIFFQHSMHDFETYTNSQEPTPTSNTNHHDATSETSSTPPPAEFDFYAAYYQQSKQQRRNDETSDEDISSDELSEDIHDQNNTHQRQ